MDDFLQKIRQWSVLKFPAKHNGRRSSKQASFSPAQVSELYNVACDGVSHHALGGGSYAFKDQFSQYLAKLIRKGPKVEVNLIIQPNSSPHFGTLFSMALAFGLARKLKVEGFKPIVMLDLWDNAKAEQIKVGGIICQRGLKSTGQLMKYIDDYRSILSLMKGIFEVDYRLRMEEEFLQEAAIPDVVKSIIHDRTELGLSLSPSTGNIALRSPCPVLGCGLVDKYGVNNRYDEQESTVTFACPDHGDFLIDLNTQCDRLQFNCQLFNLVIGRFYQDVNFGYVQICGSDYAGFWQEQLLWRHLSRPILIVYTPLIIDWSGSKLSKSLYLQRNAYQYLKDAGLEYMLSYQIFKEQNKDLTIICDEVEKWLDEPFRLFRAYSVQYMKMLFESKESITLGVIHQQEYVHRDNV